MGKVTAGIKLCYTIYIQPAMKKRIASIFATKTRAEWTSIFAGQLALNLLEENKPEKAGSTEI